MFSRHIYPSVNHGISHPRPPRHTPSHLPSSSSTALHCVHRYGQPRSQINIEAQNLHLHSRVPPHLRRCQSIREDVRQTYPLLAPTRSITSPKTSSVTSSSIVLLFLSSFRNSHYTYIHPSTTNQNISSPPSIPSMPSHAIPHPHIPSHHIALHHITLLYFPLTQSTHPPTSPPLF